MPKARKSAHRYFQFVVCAPYEKIMWNVMISREFVCSLVICLRSSLKYSNIHAQFFDCFVYCHFNFFFFPHAKKSKQIIIYKKIHTRNFERTVIKKWTGLLVFNPDIKNWRGKHFGFVIKMQQMWLNWSKNHGKVSLKESKQCDLEHVYVQ